MRLRQIEIFYHVYRAGTISGAARELNVSQPSVSKVLRHAEDQLGIDLFARRKGRLVPTPAADELYRDVEDLYRRIEIFNKSLEQIRDRSGGQLRIGVLPSMSLSVGPELIAAMRQEDGDFKLELTTLHSPDLPTSLFEKRIDLCIGFGPITDSRIKSTKVSEAKLVLVSRKQLAEPGDLVDETVLQGADFIGLRDSGPLGALVARELDMRGIQPIEVVTAHTYHVALSLVRKSVGLALTDQYTAYSQLGTGLHRYFLDDMPSVPVFASRLSDHPYPGQVELAIQVLQETMAKLDRGIAELRLPKT